MSVCKREVYMVVRVCEKGKTNNKQVIPVEPLGSGVLFPGQRSNPSI